MDEILKRVLRNVRLAGQTSFTFPESMGRTPRGVC